MTRPESNISTWSEMSRAKFISWVTQSIVMSVVCAMSRSTSRTPATSSGSSAEVTSSSSSTCGRIASARAIATRCCWPPESWLGYLSSVGEPDQVEQLAGALLGLVLGQAEDGDRAPR